MPPSADADPPVTLDALLGQSPALAADPALRDVARALFEYTQFLLDDEENLTRTGNPTGEARAKLARRALDLLGVEPLPAASADEPEDGA